MLALEVYYTHRVDEVKGRDLTRQYSVPWVEVRAQDILDNPLVFQPVVQATTQKELGRLKPRTPWTISFLKAFDEQTEYQGALFHARRSQQTLRSEHRCPECEAQWVTELQRQATRQEVECRAQLQEQEQSRLRAEAEALSARNRELQAISDAQRAREYTRREEQFRELERRREQTRQQQQVDALKRQRSKYGQRQRHHLSPQGEQFLDEHPRVVRDILNYLVPQLRDFLLLRDRRLDLKACPKCGGQIVHIDTREHFGTLGPYRDLLKYWKKPGATRGWVFNVCQHCGHWQKRVEHALDWQTSQSVDGATFLEILSAFGQLPYGETYQRPLRVSEMI